MVQSKAILTMCQVLGLLNNDISAIDFMNQYVRLILPELQFNKKYLELKISFKKWLDYGQFLKLIYLAV